MFYSIQLNFPFLCFRNNHSSHYGDFSFAGGIQCVFDWLHQDTEIQNLYQIMIIAIGYTGGFLSGAQGREVMALLVFFHFNTLLGKLIIDCHRHRELLCLKNPGHDSPVDFRILIETSICDKTTIVRTIRKAVFNTCLLSIYEIIGKVYKSHFASCKITE